MRTSSQRQVKNRAKFEAENRLEINKMIAFWSRRKQEKIVQKFSWQQDFSLYNAHLFAAKVVEEAAEKVL